MINNTEVFVTSKDYITQTDSHGKSTSFGKHEKCPQNKYKSSYKVLIQFQRQEDALKLIECQTFQEKGLQCQLIQDFSISYEVVKGVETLN